jgi:hypothetical protein
MKSMLLLFIWYRSFNILFFTFDTGVRTSGMKLKHTNFYNKRSKYVYNREYLHYYIN